MDDLSSFPEPQLQGGTGAIANMMKPRPRPAHSFRAAWEPAVVSPAASQVPPPYRRTPRRAERALPAVSLNSTPAWRSNGAIAVMTPPRAPGLTLPDLAHPVADVATAVRQRVHISPSRKVLERALEILPFALAAALISSVVWGALWLPVPLVIVLLGFDMYWAWRSLNMGFHTIKGYRALKAAARIDWRKQYDAERITRNDVLDWDDVRHVVIIPTYKESVEKLSATLGKLAESEVALQKLLVVIAMEEADAEAPARFEVLQRDFGHCFLAMVGTTHPQNIPGEVRGKSSNEAWAAKKAKRLFCDEMGFDLDHDDGDELRRRHALPSALLQRPHLLLRHEPTPLPPFWQGPIFYYNNVWDVPAPLRIQNSLGGINHLAKLVRKYTVLFPQSTYSLSMRMCHDVGYWDVDVVPEDWHMFLKCFFALGGEPDVQPILLPVGNDGVRAHSYTRTFWEHYQQARRHAWGCTDIPYAIKQSFAHPEIPLRRRCAASGASRKTTSCGHRSGSSSRASRRICRPAAGEGFFGLHPFAQHNIPTWFITASHWILLPCMIPLIG